MQPLRSLEQCNPLTARLSGGHGSRTTWSNLEKMTKKPVSGGQVWDPTMPRQHGYQFEIHSNPYCIDDKSCGYMEPKHHGIRLNAIQLNGSESDHL